MVSSIALYERFLRALLAPCRDNGKSKKFTERVSNTVKPRTTLEGQDRHVSTSLHDRKKTMFWTKLTCVSLVRPTWDRGMK